MTQTNESPRDPSGPQPGPSLDEKVRAAHEAVEAMSRPPVDRGPREGAMRLADLHPKLAGGFLGFDCPYPGHTHRQRVPVSRDHGSYRAEAPVWFMTGEFPDSLTLSPSINADTPTYPCWHGHIVNGEIR